MCGRFNHFRLKIVIFRALQHFAAKFCYLTDFNTLFLAVVIDCTAYRFKFSLWLELLQRGITTIILTHPNKLINISEKKTDSNFHSRDII